jgi:hypothetical protein
LSETLDEPVVVDADKQMSAAPEHGEEPGRPLTTPKLTVVRNDLTVVERPKLTVVKRGPGPPKVRRNRDWQRHILPEAARILAEAKADTGIDFTKRQLWYVLLTQHVIELRPGDNTTQVYSQMCAASADWQRRRRMPKIDLGRSLDRDPSWRGPRSALDALVSQYRRDRTARQDCCLMVGAEKDTMRAQLREWYSDLGIPRFLTRGYSSQPYIDDIVEFVERDGRPGILIYGGDYDVDGFDIEADFQRRTGLTIIRIALMDEHYDSALSISAKRKQNDPRRVAFRRTHPIDPAYGTDRAMEIEALNPPDLKALYDAQLARYWDDAVYQAVLAREEEERAALEDLEVWLPEEDEGDGEDEHDEDEEDD